jgi:nucleotide-binding universal stress UspA family protein
VVFKKALLTLDRSSFAAEAIPRVADVTTSEAVVLGVVESVASILSRSGPAFDVPPDLAERIVESETMAVRTELEAAAKQLREAGVAKVSTALREGRAGPEIVKFAAEERCDVIVMSTHGRTGLRGALLGSVANYVVHHVEDVAVLLVRPSKD